MIGLWLAQFLRQVFSGWYRVLLYKRSIASGGLGYSLVRQLLIGLLQTKVAAVVYAIALGAITKRIDRAIPLVSPRFSKQVLP